MSSQLMRYCRSLGRYEAGLREALKAYASVVEPSMGFARERELESVAASSQVMDCHVACLTVQSLASLIEGSRVCVMTPGMASMTLLKEGCDVVIATDSAIEEVARLGVMPAAIVGDADPSLRLLGMATRLGVPYLLHSHGDNLYRVAQLVRSLGPASVVITSQVDTPDCALPVGAFTDGDRAAVIAMAMRAKRVIMGLIGSEPLCGHKDYCEAPVKRRKLELAWKVIAMVAERTGYKITRTSDLVVLERP